MEAAIMSFAELGDPAADARVELLREARQLLVEWERDRHPVTRGMLLATLDALKLLVKVEP
jgi:hypothetical protein